MRMKEVGGKGDVKQKTTITAFLMTFQITFLLSASDWAPKRGSILILAIPC